MTPEVLAALSVEQPSGALGSPHQPIAQQQPLQCDKSQNTDTPSGAWTEVHWQPPNPRSAMSIAPPAAQRNIESRSATRERRQPLATRSLEVTTKTIVAPVRHVPTNLPPAEGGHMER
eukprot:CAMPEP_0206287006 /NCGR_PEP_ID=MMETSP0106_2-20121207/889_1 /ASSEMBLY_ACC=CAM_ASM_000206 /TAXON_ID=81532 /ORGANISM="Acanthoeca-like sp., Strain 10tr" /LENGTH=117 /DNA_ID=CAMNT_0053717537 /DNA_START=784 /DNA_END=1141 /DNA_ORIENTATION=-